MNSLVVKADWQAMCRVTEKIAECHTRGELEKIKYYKAIHQRLEKEAIEHINDAIKGVKRDAHLYFKSRQATFKQN